MSLSHPVPSLVEFDVKCAERPAIRGLFASIRNQRLGQFSRFCRAVSEFSLTGMFVVPSGVPDISRFGDREHSTARSSARNPASWAGSSSEPKICALPLDRIPIS